MLRVAQRALLFSIGLWFAASANAAQLTNSGFENGTLSGWEFVGDASVSAMPRCMAASWASIQSKATTPR